MSFFESNKIKEQNTLELEYLTTTATNIEFNYFPIQCNGIQRNTAPPHEIRANYRADRPTVIYRNNQYFPTYYQPTELSITRKTQPGNHNAEMIVKHIPVSASITNLYVCFPLIQTADNAASKNITLNDFIKTATESPSPDFFDGLDLSEYIKDGRWRSYESVDETGVKCIVVVMEQAINVFTDLTIFKETATTSPAASTTAASTPTITTTEGFVQDATTHGYEFTNDGNNEMVCEIIPGDEDTEMIDMYQIPIGGKAYVDRQNMNNTITVVFLVMFLAIFFFNLVVFPSVYTFLLNSMDDTRTLKRPVNLFGLNFGTGLWVVISAIYALIIFILLVIGLATSETSYIMFSVLLIMSYFVALYGLKIKNIIMDAT